MTYTTRVNRNHDLRYKNAWLATRSHTVSESRTSTGWHTSFGSLVFAIHESVGENFPFSSISKYLKYTLTRLCPFSVVRERQTKPSNSVGTNAGAPLVSFEIMSRCR